MKTGLESLDTGAPKITYSGNEGPQAPQQMATADPLLMEEYQKYVFEMEEQGLQPMSFKEFEAQARAGMNKGGIAQLVKSSGNGKRPGYRGDDARKSAAAMGRGAMGTDRKSTSSSGGDGDARERYIAEQYTRTTPKTVTPSSDGDDLEDDSGTKIDPRIKPTTSYMDKAKEIFLGPGQYLVNKIGKASMVPFLKYRKNAHLKTLGTDDPNIYEEDKTYKAIVNALNLAEQGELSNKEFQDFMPGNIYGKELKDFGPDQSGDGSQIYPYPYPTSTAMAPPTVPPVVPPVQTANPFLPGSNLPFSTYGTAAHGTQFGVDPRMFAADGGRIGYFAGDIVDPEGYDISRREMGILANADPSKEEMIRKFLKRIKHHKPIYPDRILEINRGKRTGEAQGGRIGYAGGGIADLRQGYFLGKLVKKATRGIKKIIKSPIGKAALLAGGAGLFGHGPAAKLFSGGKGLAFKNFLADKILGTMKYGHPTEAGVRTGGLLDFLKTGRGAMTGIAALSSLPLLFGSSEEEDEKDYYADATNIFNTVGSPDELRARALRGELPQNEFPFQSYYAADGGRVGLMGGGNIRAAALNQLYGINDDEDKKLSKGGSAGLPPITSGVEGQNLQSFSDDETPMPTQQDQMPRPNPMMAGRMNPMMAGRTNPMMARGMMPRVMAQEGGLMDMGGMEKDYRNEGGFVPIGGQERADDVPARLSKNEFVFTADAVRNAGGGNIDKGAEIMENMMENLEKGGKVSEESQGLKGARDMFATAQRLEGVL